MNTLLLLNKEISLINKNSIFLSAMIGLSILFMHMVNIIFYQYAPIEYISNNLIFFCFMQLGLIYLGCTLLLPNQHFILKKLTGFIIIFSVTSLIAVYTSAIQLTPYSPIDNHLVLVDKLLGINTPQILKFTYQHPYLERVFHFSYSLISIELAFTLLLMAFCNQKKNQEAFIFLLLSSALIGFSFYYFFPTTAPASILQSPFFLEHQYLTNLKFQLLHHYLPTHQLVEGGLIAMPSFHCIWALLCQYILTRQNKKLGLFIFPVNFCLILSCLFLGWHYLSDIIVSLIICTTLIFLTKKLEQNDFIENMSYNNKTNVNLY